MGRCLVFISLAVAWTGCGPSAPVAIRAHESPPAARVVDEPPVKTGVQAPLRPVSAPEHPVSSPRVVRWSARGVAFHGVAFDSRSHRLVVVDQPGGPGSKFATAAEAARSVGGVAAVNAGFFTPAGEPVGLVVSGGNHAGAWNGSSSIGSGVWHATSAGDARIVRREAIGAAAARRMPELLQSGPMLVDSGREVRGLLGGDPRPRTLIVWDGGHRWWMGCAGPCAMPDMAAALAGGSGPGFPVHMALNLDGGRSSELWVGGGVVGGPLTSRPVWNRAVRNHLVLVGR